MSNESMANSITDIPSAIAELLAINKQLQEEKQMNVLSLFDGMSCGQLALQKAGIHYDNYYAAEIDKYAIKVSSENFPNIIHLGDVAKVKSENLPKIDLLIGGSPCQGFSFAGKQLNFNDPRSALFFEYVRLLKELKPKYFLLENVVMKKEFQAVITEHLGVEPIMINSSLVSAQNRRRLYWTNIPNVTQPEDKKIYLKDILEKNSNTINFSSSGRRNKIGYRFNINSEKSMTLTASGFSCRSFTGKLESKPIQLNTSKESANKQPFVQNRIYSSEGKSPAITSSFGQRLNVMYKENEIKKLSVIECKRLQTVPDDYKMNVSDSQTYKMLGNGWTVDVIAHIFKGIEEKSE